MELYRPSVDRLPVLEQYLGHNHFYGCEFSPANLVMWWERYDTYYTTVADMLVFCKVQEGKPVAFTFPVGTADEKQAFDAIVRYFHDNDLPVFFYLIEQAMFDKIDRWYPGMYRLTFEREDADYLYQTHMLAELPGKKLHAKRNHIHRFLENYPDYIYEEISDNNIEECLELAENWANEKLSDVKKTGETNEAVLKQMDEFSYELHAIELAFQYREQLHMRGALIRVGGKVIAFTIGSPLNFETFDIHFEKAYAHIQGAYAMINREFAKRSLAEYRLINREEDLGIPGLRKAKLSYQPECILEKGNVTMSCAFE
ncbi:MAG: phosphatidylglycerol lysyltransferase domain-containing protein [Eubacteriales bacterium]|nr:phosphatidylglycerol lysyltransferase domain-containing protein [Eubacteriales bacterium]